MTRRSLYCRTPSNPKSVHSLFALFAIRQKERRYRRGSYCLFSLTLKKRGVQGGTGC